MPYHFEVNIERCMTRLGFYPPDVFDDIMSVEANVRATKVAEILEKFRKEQKKQLSLNHPDKGGTAERFREIKEAFEILESFFTDTKDRLERKYSPRGFVNEPIVITTK